MSTAQSDIREILDHNPEADARDLGPIVYYHTPCANCRHDTVELLLKRDAAPAWLIQECRDDADDDTRKLVASASQA